MENFPIIFEFYFLDTTPKEKQVDYQGLEANIAKNKTS